MIESSTQDAVAMAAENDATLTNNGKIEMKGSNSVAIYTNGAVGLSTGIVSVKDSSIAYYAEDSNNSSNGLEISGSAVTELGDSSILLAVSDGGKIDYQAGEINLGANKYGALIGKSNSFGTKSFIDFHNNNIRVGEKSIAIILKDDGEINNTLGDIYVGNEGIGVLSFSNISGISTTGRTIYLSSEAIGIYNEGTDTDTVLSGSIISTMSGAKGIINKDPNTSINGSIINNGAISLLGDESIGLYGENINTILNNQNKIIEVGNTDVKSSMGIYGKNIAGLLKNDGNIIFGSGAIGIYGENITKIENSSLGIIHNDSKTNGTGLFVKNSIVENNGSIILGGSSVGIHGENSSVKNTANIIVGDLNSAGIYGKGTTTIENNAIVQIGSNSTGIFTEFGNIINASSIASTGENSTYIYSESGNITNSASLDLTDYSVGIYGASGIVINNNMIKVGKSDTSSTEMKFSVGMYTKTGNIINSNGAVIDVNKEAGIGMFVSGIPILNPSNGLIIGYSASGTAENHGLINVSGLKGYGIQATNGAKVYNAPTGKINVMGNGAVGIAASNNVNIENAGIINVTGSGTQGISIDRGSSFENVGSGKLIVNGTGNVGVYIGVGGILVNSGGIEINSGATAVFDGGGAIHNIGEIEINGSVASIGGNPITNIGVIKVNGILDFTNNILLETTAGTVGKIEVQGITGHGNIILSPGATQGTNNEMYHVQLLDGLSPNVSAGDLTVISQSVTFLGEKYYDTKLGSYVFTLTKIPYKELLKNTLAEGFGQGLDALYPKALHKELDMFDEIDSITNKDELAEVFDMELRGNFYANIQQRMMSMNDIFDSSYNRLKNEKNDSKNTSKITAIYVKGNFSEKNAGVEDYDYNSMGILYLGEKEGLIYGKALNYSIGFLQSKFDFDDNSKENISSIKLGIGYEQYLNRESKFKITTRGELGVNYHDAERKINLSKATYTNNTDYFSGTIDLKNKIKYEIPLAMKNINVGMYGSFNLGYGEYQNFSETGDGIYLDIKSQDYFSIRPGIGIDGDFSYNIKNSSKLSLKLGISYEYELMEIYGDGNKARIKDTNTDYYRLEKPKKIKNILKVNIGLGYEMNDFLKFETNIEKIKSSQDETKFHFGIIFKF